VITPARWRGPARRTRAATTYARTPIELSGMLHIEAYFPADDASDAAVRAL
jgi:hypothetical protein